MSGETSKWWRAGTVAVIAAAAMAGGWIGLLRSAPTDPPPLEEPAGSWSRQPAIAPPTVEVVPAGATSPVETPPIVPAADSSPPVSSSTPVLPVIPVAAPPELPVLPPLPKGPAPSPTPPADTSRPVVAPAVPVLPPPAVVPSAPPGKLPLDPEPKLSDKTTKSDSGLQGDKVGNSVKTDTGAGAPMPILPPGDPAGLSPVVPILPAVPAAGAPREIPGRTVERAKPSHLPLEYSEKYVFPIPLTPESATGEPPVRVLHNAAAAAMIGGMFLAPASSTPAAPPIPAVPAPLRINANEQVDVAALKTQVEGIDKKLEEIKKDLKFLTEILNGRKDDKGIPLPSDQGLVADLKKLKDSLALLDGEVQKLRTQSSSLRPAPGVTTDPKASKGTVRVVNEYPVQISIVINGTSYRVAPTRSMDVEVPAGDFSYHLLESGAAPTRSSIKEKETVTLRIK